MSPTWTPPKPLGPRKRSHSAAMSAQRHSNRCTMAVLPFLVCGLCWARPSPNRATRMNHFMFPLDERENNTLLPLLWLVFILVRFLYRTNERPANISMEVKQVLLYQGFLPSFWTGRGNMRCTCTPSLNVTWKETEHVPKTLMPPEHPLKYFHSLYR